MRVADLDLIKVWMSEPHVARWYLAGSTLEEELCDLGRSISGMQPTHALVVTQDGADIGWCQWYLCRDYPDHAADVAANDKDVGIDYAIGDPSRTGSGVGTELIARLVEHVRMEHPRAGVIADPEATNIASRRVLEKNGFRLADERRLASERTDAVMAIYRLSPEC